MNALQTVWADISQVAGEFWSSRDPSMRSWRLLIRDCSWNNIFSRQLPLPDRSEEAEWKTHVLKLYFALSKYFRMSFVSTKNSSNHWCFLKGTQLSPDIPLLHQHPKKTVSSAHENHHKMVFKIQPVGRQCLRFHWDSFRFPLARACANNTSFLN